MSVCMKSNTAKGYLCVIAAALMWASCGTVGKALFNAGMSPFILVQTRVTFASLILVITLMAWRPALLKITLRDLCYFLLFGGVFMALMQLSYFMAISKIQVAAAILVQYMAPVLVACFSMLFWHERVSRLKILALGLSLAGCYLVVGGYNLTLLSMNRSGIMWALLSAFAFASTTLLGEKMMHNHNPITTLTYGLVFSALSLNIIQTPLSILSQSYTAQKWAAILYTATLEPIAAAFMAFFLLHESLSPLQITGGLSVIAAIVMLQWEREHDALSPDNIRANKND